jgi:alcohol dehydrogenase (cytochrome c)
VTPHDVRDHDFQATPVVAGDNVIGAGKGGRMIAWNRESRRRIWTASVGLHLNDKGPLPRRKVKVCPGLLGGVETQMAYAGDRVFVSVVDLCFLESAITSTHLDSVDPAEGNGSVVALDVSTGKELWTRRFSSPTFGCATVANDVVFTQTYDGRVYALASDDGRVLWNDTLRAGSNSCPAVVDKTLFVGAGVPRDGSTGELVAYALH